MPIKRSPVVAGQFYAAGAHLLKEEIEDLFPKTPISRREEISGAILPHAGYIYSGATATKTVLHLPKRPLFILLGPNHTGYGKEAAIMTKGIWETPLGDVEIEEELANLLLERIPLLKEDILAHQYEHSLEVELPILQVTQETFKIIPIAFKDIPLEWVQTIGKGLGEVLKEKYPFGKKYIIIASSDFTHYEPYEIAKNKDKIALEAILNLDEVTLLEKVKRVPISMCGYIPIAVLLVAIKEITPSKTGELIEYTTSGEKSGDYSRVVGYAGVIF